VTEGDCSRALRLIEMIRMLEARSWSKQEMGDRLGVSLRTIERDLLDLQSEPLYVPLVEQSGRWRVLDNAPRQAPKNVAAS